jgi:hypothetical protein
VSGSKPKERVYEVTWTNVTYWHRVDRGPPCAFAESERRAWLTSLRPSRAGFKVSHIDDAFIRVAMSDEPFKHPGYGLTTREALRLRRVIEQPALAGEGG